MNKKKLTFLYILLGVLAVCCLVTFLIKHHEERQENIKAEEAVILEIDPDDVTALAFSYDDTSFSFTKEDGTWKYDEDEAFPVSEDKINELLSVFESFSSAFKITEPESLATYGLKNPEGTITITTADETYTISLGDFSKMDSERYVSIGDDNVYLAAVDPMDTYQVELTDMIQTDEVPNVGQLQSMEVSGSEDYTYTYDEDKTSLDEDDVYFYGDLPLDTSLVNTYVAALEYVDLSTYVTYNPSDADLATYGLDDPTVVTLTYTDRDDDSKKTCTLRVGKKDETDETSTATVYGYIQLGDSGIIYQISEDDYDTLAAAGYDDLRHKDVITADFDLVTEMDVTLDGATYTFTRSGDKDDDGNELWTMADGTQVVLDDVQSDVLALSADSFVDKMPSGASDEEISFTLHLDSEVASTIQVDLYRYDGEDCVAKIDGTVTSLVTRSQVVDLMETIRGLVL